MPSRREIIQLTDSEVREYLGSQKTLIIVSNGPNGYPHAMPMWFWVHGDGCLYCTTFAKSQKVMNWRRDPKATLLVESGEEYAQLKGVVIYATTEIIDEFERVQDALVDINAAGRDLDGEARAKLRESVAANAHKRVLLKFIPERYVTWDHAKLGGRY